MFDRHKDAFFDGHFPITIVSKAQPDGRWEASFTSPLGHTVTATDADLQAAHRLCADKVREGVLSGEITLGR